ncbi:MAG: hypothetical protein KTR25_20365 [Myxococcales bacterium]|nr:hypothetical protein [Myxococcales bacterium]
MEPFIGRRFLGLLAAGVVVFTVAFGHAQPRPIIEGIRSGTPPEWALLQRQLIRMSSEACERFFSRFFDERGYFLAYERYGANDGPDDAIENLNNWPLLHAIGAKDELNQLVLRGWEGHLRQYTLARDSHVPVANEGMYYKEFHVQFDWQHHAEGVSVFNLMGLSNPNYAPNKRRAQRFAGLYMGEDPGAPNWDPVHKMIRSLLNGSRGPMLRDATALDWAGGPFEVEHRFFMEHGEKNYDETLAHYQDYTEVVGDHPLNLLSTTLAFQAYVATGDIKYRTWILEYVNAWIDRAKRNDHILPSNVGLDGKIGTAYGGRWWAGTYGWGFSPVDPTTGKRANRNRVPRTVLAFYIAYVLTGDDTYLEVWRKQTDRLNAYQRVSEGEIETPTMYGEQGWYGWRKGLNQDNSQDIWWFSQKLFDRRRAPAHPWLSFLEKTNPDWPVTALRKDLQTVYARAQALTKELSTPDTRLADAVLDLNPAVVTTLMQQTMGAIHIARPSWSKTSPSIGGSPLFARIRHFDPVRRRAGLPEDVAALVTGMDLTTTTVELVNLHLVDHRDLIIQGGGYAEHQIHYVVVDGTKHKVEAPWVKIRLQPGAHAMVELTMKRYANPPTQWFPWDRQ